MNTNQMTTHADCSVTCRVTHFTDSKADRGVGKLYSRKMEDGRCALTAVCWFGEAARGLTTNGASYTISYRRIFGFLSSVLRVGNRDKN